MWPTEVPSLHASRLPRLLVARCVVLFASGLSSRCAYAAARGSSNRESSPQVPAQVCAQAVVLIDVPPTHLVCAHRLTGVCPAHQSHQNWQRCAVLRNESSTKASQAYQAAVGLLGSTAFVTTAFELPYILPHGGMDVELRFACAVVVASAATGATLAAFEVQEESLRAPKLRVQSSEFIRARKQQTN